MKLYKIHRETYDWRGDHAVFETCKRLGWHAVRTLEDDILIEYPEEDEMIFQMLTWKEDSEEISSMYQRYKKLRG